jgi:hypothetical protein
MALDIYSADDYIETNVIVIEDWTDCDEDKKQRLLNVANSTLSRVYPDYTIPDEAVYEFSAVLATAYNDTNVQKQNGVKQFSVSGISYTFGEKQAVETLIPSSARALISKANGVSLSRVKWTVL